MHPTSRLKRPAAITLIALFALACVPRAPAHHHQHQNSARQPVTLAQHDLTAACDFDADVRQDHITLQSNGYDKTVKIHFANARKSELSFTARTAEAGRLVAGDIDRDGDVDLIWVGAADRQSAVVLINDGEGNFVEAPDVSAYASELDGLFSSGDSSGNQKLKRGRRSSSLTSASFHEVGLRILTWFQTTEAYFAPVSVTEKLNAQSGFIAYLRKRGPPISLS